MAIVPDLSGNYSQSNPGIDPHIYSGDPEPFKPATGQSSMTISAGAASAATMFNPNRYGTARIYNAGTAAVYVNFGDSTVTATNLSMQIPAGQTEVVTIPGGAQYVAMLASSGTQSVSITPGDGI